MGVELLVEAFGYLGCPAQSIFHLHQFAFSCLELVSTEFFLELAFLGLELHQSLRLRLVLLLDK